MDRPLLSPGVPIAEAISFSYQGREKISAYMGLVMLPAKMPPQISYPAMMGEILAGGMAPICIRLCVIVGCTQ